MRYTTLITAVLLGGASWPPSAQEMTLSPTDTAAAFKAAGYKLKGTKWMACAEGTVSEVRDINGDGLPDAIVSEGGTKCHGMTGEGYSLVSKQSNGSWKLVSGGTGIPLFLKTRAKGWPDLQVGGPGFCFPVLRWNGQSYTLNRYEYEGKRCKP
ncbi:hypothetical protein [Acidovorax sp. SRB_24]|uniref:hypothetical protein n=1 Tax=Acidovorax sp. SRB_24 TaxID=1962700 RepID=UPI00197BC1D6|nr:hypothetical protein [Acidovorax sp. SRB_24]NMM77650.1 hypothetical protein [Acidovorax sp. SRB_24]